MDDHSPEPYAGAGSPSSASLFPLFPVSSNSPAIPTTSSNDPQWLSNSSFTFDVSTIPAPAAAAMSDEDAAEESPDRWPSPQPPKYDLLRSPSPSASVSNSEGEGERRSRRKKKKRKRERGKERVEEAGSRKSAVRAWAGSDRKPAKDYYFDVKGDRDNLAFGCLYRMDIARYKVQSVMDSSSLCCQFVYRFKPQSLNIGIDTDLDGLDIKARVGGRYCSVKYATLERNKGFKHLKIIRKKNFPWIQSEEYISLDSDPKSIHESNGTDNNASSDIEESWEDELIRKTREFNKMSREFPHDEKVWLAFAEFQDKIASRQPQKAARVQTIERKISILEKAVELNPESEDLLLCLLGAYRERDTTEDLLKKWENMLAQHYDSVRLWKEYLIVCQGEFSRFKVSELRRNYAHAIQALSAACYKLSRQDSPLVELELGLVDVFVNLCRFEWQTGHRELATGLFQAQIEYSLFCPPLQVTASSKQRLFEHFWNSSGARIGEDGAVGWSTWLAKDEENRHKNVIVQESSQEEEVGGWSGWFDPRSNQAEPNTKTEEERTDNFMPDGNDENNPDNEDDQTQDDVELLLKKLGIDVVSESNSEVKDAKVWRRWSKEEITRGKEQWIPVRENSVQEEENEQLSRVILFDDVTDYLFSICSYEARFSLICQFIDFYGGNISQWTCTNSSTWLSQIQSLETIPCQISQYLRPIHNPLNNKIQSSNCSEPGSIMGIASDFPTSFPTMKFLRNTIFLCLDIFPRNHLLQEALLFTEQSIMVQSNDSSNLVNPSRALAKNLLKKDRQDFLLCGVYARSEVAHGNIDLARKIFDMALLSIENVSKDLQEKAPLLYLWYTEMEIANDSESSLQRAIHILSCLGNNAKYTPFASPLLSPQILRARQGFRERIKSTLAEWARGIIKEHSVAFVCSASLFEIINYGLPAGLEVIEEAFSMVLPERRSRSLELELLWSYYIKLLQKHFKQLTFPQVWKIISQGLQIYPFSPKSFSAMLARSSLYSVPNKVRLLLDKCTQRSASVIVWLFALHFEWEREGSGNRIRALLERALSSDKMQKSVILWRIYLFYEAEVARNPTSARRVFFRAIHSCPWSKRLWLDGFEKLSSILTLTELSDLQEVMRDKELHIRTDVYEILLQDEMDS